MEKGDETMKGFLETVFCIFVTAEFVVGMGVTIAKVILPALKYVTEFIMSYNEFREWRKTNGKQYDETSW